MGASTPAGVLIDHAQDLILLMDETGRIRFANDAADRILGYEGDELVGRNAFDLVHPASEAEAWDAFKRTIAAESYTETTIEHRGKRRDGSWVWLESRVSNLSDETLEGYVISSRDISERVAAQRDHEETATRLEELAATTGEVLWMFNSDWTELLFLNPAYETVYGGSVSEVEADPESFTDPVHPDDVPLVEEGMERLSGGESIDMEYRVNPEQDYSVWVWVQAEPIMAGGEVVRITGFTRDVTERRRRNRQLIVMDNLLRHNLRNDLNAIMSNAELIEQEVPAAAERTAVIRQTGRDLLASAEKEREIIALLTGAESRSAVDVPAAIKAAVEEVADRHPDADIEWTCAADVSALARTELRLALVELLENAVRHSDQAHPTVRIDARPTRDKVDITVTDDAPTMPAIEAQVLTGEEGMTNVYHSSGLGLWLVYWVVELSEGRITVQPADSRGNRVRLTVPIHLPESAGG